jgi:hypothetical protein
LDYAEFVPTQSGGEITCPDAKRESHGDLPQEFITCSVTQRVVYWLEAIEIQAKNGNLFTLPATVCESSPKLIAEKRSVRQVRQDIMSRKVGNLVLVAASFIERSRQCAYLVVTRGIFGNNVLIGSRVHFALGQVQFSG